MIAEETILSEVILALAPLERRAGSGAEEQAASWLAARFRSAGCETQVDAEPFHDGFARVLGRLAQLGVLAGLTALPENRRVRQLAAAAAAAVTAAIADDVSNGPRVFRRATARPSRTWNVVGRCGDRSAKDTLVLLAHHDAAQTGMIFDQRLQALVAERFPELIERIDTGLPLWWWMLSGPALVALGAARGRRGMIGVGTIASLVSTAVLADIARSPVVPGANDNLSGVALLVAFAERLRHHPIDGLGVWLVSCGAEEVLQGGIHGFAQRHFGTLDRDRTWFLNLETIGSPKLMMLEGEGPVVMEDYHDRDFRDLVAQVADHAGIPLRRGMRARTSTDAVIPSRAGFPTATLSSMNHYKALSNYHLPSDIPENIDYATVAQALALTEAVARELATSP